MQYCIFTNDGENRWCKWIGASRLCHVDRFQCLKKIKSQRICLFASSRNANRKALSFLKNKPRIIVEPLPLVQNRYGLNQFGFEHDHYKYIGELTTMIFISTKRHAVILFNETKTNFIRNRMNNKYNQLYLDTKNTFLFGTEFKYVDINEIKKLINFIHIWTNLAMLHSMN